MAKKAIKLPKTTEKLLIFAAFLVWVELISSWIFETLILFPPGGGGNTAGIFTLTNRPPMTEQTEQTD